MLQNMQSTHVPCLCHSNLICRGSRLTIVNAPEELPMMLRSSFATFEQSSGEKNHKHSTCGKGVLALASRCSKKSTSCT